MTEHPVVTDERRASPWRTAAWTAAALLLLAPLVAMQFTDEVAWDPADFAVFGVMIVAAGVTFELAAKRTTDATYRSAAGYALAAAFLLVWVNGAVGIIGSEDNDANLMYFGVLAVGIVGTLIARFEPRAMSRALFATALAQVVVTVIALAAGLGSPVSGPGEILFLNTFFVALWLTSAWLFEKAARGQAQNVHYLLSITIAAIGLALAIGKIYADGEPGGIPIVLIVAGAAWFLFARARHRPAQA